MKNMIIVVAMTMLSGTNWASTDECEIINGSFEDDGLINDITVYEPNGWDPNIALDKFTGRTDASWSTDGNFSLLIFSQWYTAFTAGDTAVVSQDVLLNDVNEITFDLKLNTYSGLGWDPNIATAVVIIDGEVVWEPNSTGPDMKGVYIDQSYTVEDRYRDDNPHTLSFGLRINVDTDSSSFEYYRLWWDSVECVIYCDGGGLLAGDFNRDCYVDVKDLEQVADVWLLEVESGDKYNLYRDDDVAGFGTVNFYDLAILADNWLLGSYKEQQEADAVDINGY